jgi:hypothetical protein
MQTWRGCPPIIGHFAELQEQHDMTQTSEPGSKSENGERTRQNGAQSTNAERYAINDNSEHLRFAPADLETNSGVGFAQHRGGIRVPAGGALAPGPSAWRNELRIPQIAVAATAFLFAGLAPALVMATLWHTVEIAPLAFTFTFVIAISHTIFLGLPLFLVFRSMGWINLMTCIVFGFAVGAAPAGVLTWPMQQPELHASASVDGVPTIINGTITAAGWISFVKPLIYFGSFGALGGFAFWVALIWRGTFESDYFNPSIAWIHRPRDGGFGAAARAGQLSRGGSARHNGREIACESEKTQRHRSRRYINEPGPAQTP